MDRVGIGFSADIFGRRGKSRRLWDDRRRGITMTSLADGIFFTFCFKSVIPFII
jgi:hypothetical protein